MKMAEGENHETEREDPRKFIPRIKDMDPDDTPREKAEKYGCGVLPVADLWALILRTGTVGRPITELCRDLMRANDGLMTRLERRSRKELLAIKGLGKLKVLQIEAVLELIRRYNSEEPLNNPIMRSSRDIFNIMRPKLGHLDHEEIWVMLLNRRNEMMECRQLFRGGTDSSLFDIKVLMKMALLEGATSIVLCHNHPSGNLKSSPADDNLTRATREACAYFSIRLMDHIIVSSDNTNYFSYSDQGLL